jgi:hypothetical protein
MVISKQTWGERGITFSKNLRKAFFLQTEKINIPLHRRKNALESSGTKHYDVGTVCWGEIQLIKRMPCSAPYRRASFPR